MAVIATAELNKKKSKRTSGRTRTKGVEKGESMDRRKQSRLACESDLPGYFPPPVHATGGLQGRVVVVVAPRAG